MEAFAFITAPPVPDTSKSKVPPATVSALLMVTLPPELEAIPKVPELIVNAAVLVNAIVKKSPTKTDPAVV